MNIPADKESEFNNADRRQPCDDAQQPRPKVRGDKDMPEVDDKLIGDDLEIREAEGACNEDKQGTENNENNY